MTEDERAEKIRRFQQAVDRAKKTLKPGDKIRCTRCGGIRATYRFSHWNGSWMVSASGIDDLAASCVDRLNGKPISFLEDK